MSLHRNKLSILGNPPYGRRDGSRVYWNVI